MGHVHFSVSIFHFNNTRSDTFSFCQHHSLSLYKESGTRSLFHPFTFIIQCGTPSISVSIFHFHDRRSDNFSFCQHISVSLHQHLFIHVCVLSIEYVNAWHLTHCYDVFHIMLYQQNTFKSFHPGQTSSDCQLPWHKQTEI